MEELNLTGTIDTKSNNVKNGMMFGLIIGLVYCVSLFLRYNMLSMGPIMMAVIAFLFYCLAIGLLVFCGLKRRKELGGFISLRDAFQTIFVAVLIGELIYLVFNFIYLKYIEPDFMDKFMRATENWIEKSGLSETKKDETLEKMRTQMQNQQDKGLTLKGTVMSYLIWVCITGVFGFIVALIIRKRKPVFDAAL